MRADELPPFELIAKLPADPAAHDPAAGRELLAKRRRPRLLASHGEAALRYRPSPELLLALNMALHTGCPLLLTGEPGTGKTQAADFVSAYFGIPLFRFLVKSTSTAQDLMYEFDAVGYLHWAQSGRRDSNSRPPTGEEAELVRRGFLHKRALWQAYESEGDAVVLIDEIDKAPRDFPNDLLHELDQHSFPHPFAPGQMVKPKSGRPPIVIITSNEERRLPDAFLRRCIFHCIELDEALVRAAVHSMSGDDGAFPHLDAATLAAAQERFFDLRKLPELEKKPSTAELLTWLAILSALRCSAEDIRNCSLDELPARAALLKTDEPFRRRREAS